MNHVVRVQQLQMECGSCSHPMARWMVTCDDDGSGSRNYRHGPFKKRDAAQRAAEKRYPNLTPWIRGPKGVLSANIITEEQV